MDLINASTSSLNCLNDSYTSLLVFIKYCIISLDAESISPNMYEFSYINEGVLNGPFTSTYHWYPISAHLGTTLLNEDLVLFANLQYSQSLI